MLKIIVITVVIVIAAILILAATKPDRFRVQRTNRIKAAPEKIFPHINSFQRWDAWSPWEKKDPNMKRTFSGPITGKGAIYEWAGNSKVGTGRMEIIEASTPGKITIQLDFLKPFEAHNIAEFTMTPRGDATEVTWVMHGPSPYLAKVMQVFCSMDRMVGKDFETGLANLKTITEK